MTFVREPEAAESSAPWPRLRRLAHFARAEQLYFVLAIAIGIFSGLAVVAFRFAITALNAHLLGPVAGRSPLRSLLAPTLVGLGLGVLVVRVFPGARGSGVNQTKAALYIYDGYISFRTVLGKFITAALAIGSGQSLGPEDPSLQVGAGLASLLGRRLNLSQSRQRLLAPLGAAAGLAAAFNAPLAAVMFVIEEVIGRWSSGVIGAVVLAAVSSTVVARAFFGDHPLFAAPPFELRHASELLAYAVLGVAGGLGSLLFVKLVAWLRPRLRGLPPWTHYVQPAAAGLVIGAIGIWYPQIMGVGYVAINQAMGGTYLWPTLALLSLLKIGATALSFTSGAPGGMFAPTLFIGAMMGAAVGGAEHLLLPRLAAPVGVYALVGMGTAFAGILRAPMTSVFIVTAVSGSYEIVLPLMISNTLAYVISRRWQATPIFDLLTQQDGLTLPSMEELREEQVMHVEDAMRPAAAGGRNIPVIAAERPVREAWMQAQTAPRHFVLVDGGQGAWYGVTLDMLAPLVVRAQEERPLREVLEPGWRLPVLYPDQPLEAFLREAGDEPLLPVIHRAHGLLLGVLTLPDVMAAYHRAEGSG
ncbi:MAG TPA: chloride channel protein [Terriglobales bacterium]|nr:chloride channel protein [Terriglobales bacterium]